MLQHILNPAFLHSFEKGEGEQLLGPPNPEGDNPERITSVFITKVHMHTRLQVYFSCSQQSSHSFSPLFPLFIIQQLCLSIRLSDFINCCISSHNVLSVQYIAILSVTINYIPLSLILHLSMHPHITLSLNCCHSISLAAHILY